MVAAPAWATTAGTGPFTGTSAAYTVPSGIAKGDIILAVLILLTGSPVTVTPPDGTWSQIGGQITAGGVSSQAWWKRATGPDTGSYTWGFGTSQSVSIDHMRYTGCASSGNPFEAFDAELNASLQSVTPITTLTTLGANRLLVWAATSSAIAAGSITVPTGFTTTEWSGSRSKVVDKVQASAGATGSVQGSTSVGGGDQFTTWLYALRPPDPTSGFMNFFSGAGGAASSGPKQLTGVVYTQSNVYSTPGLLAADYAGMNDGNADGSVSPKETGVQYAAGGTHVQADTGAVHFIDHIVIGYDYKNNLPGGWDVGSTENMPIDASNDGTTWTQIGTTPVYSTTGSSNGLVTIPIGASWQYLRIGPHTAAYFALLEFQIWGN